MKNITQGTTYTVLKPEKKVPPTITFTSKALKWIEAIIDNHENEVGFYGIVEEDEVNYSYRVVDIFYPKHQLATSATCEISPEGEAAIMNWLIEHNRTTDIANMMLWGHSHHTMGISPSAQDDKQAIDRMESTRHNIIRIIVNKEKLMSVSFFDYKKQLRFDNIIWQEEKISDETINLEMLNKIRAILDSDAAHDKKIDEIDKVMYVDVEMENITAKVKELKKINIPENNYQNNHQIYGRDYSNYPTFGGCRKHGKNKKNDLLQTDAFDDFNNYPRSTSVEKEVEELMSEWNGMGE